MQSVRVLVVEDENSVAQDIRDRLTKMGTTVVETATTGEQAVQSAEQSRPDIVLMDIHLKGRLDGMEAADQIRRKFHIPVVYLTTHFDDATLERANQTQPQGYLLKPFEESDLRVNIELALSKHRLERELRESQERYATTLASIGDAVLATDIKGQITYMNAAAEKLTRWDRADALGRPLDQVFHIIDETSRSVRTSPMIRAMREGVTVDLEDPTLLITRDGEEVAVEDCAAPIVDQDKRFLGGVLVCRDATEKRKAAEAHRKAQDQIHWLQRLEAVGRLAGGMAHEINNMLTVVLGCGDLLLGQLGPDHPLRTTLETMMTAGDRSATLTRQLLAFSRKQVLSPGQLNLNQVLQRLQTMFLRLLGEDVEMILRLDPHLGMVYVDRMQWEQVLVNLSLNARDAMPEGGTLIFETRNARVEEAFTATHPDIVPGDYVLLSVRDTGCGMDEETLSHIFEPFFTTKEHGKGTGLGLATVYGIVTQSGGHVFVDSSPGEGSTFSMYLPAVAQAEPAAQPEPAPSPIPGGTETILVTEDEEIVRLWVSQALQKMGYMVLTATHGEDALQFADVFAGPIHLLLTDVIMPKMSGPDLAKALARKRAGIKVLYMSGYTDRPTLPQELRAEGAVLLQKPFTATALASKVRAVLDG